MSVESKLRELGLELPPAPKPVASYQAFVQTGNLLFISGQLPFEAGRLRYAGKLGADVTDADGYAAARLCALNALAQIQAALGGFDRLDRIVRVDGHINCTPEWTNHPQVLNGASDLFAAVLGEKAGHARTVFGQNQLPLNATVELVMIAAVKQ